MVDGKEVAWTYGRVRYNGIDDTSHLPDKNLQELHAPTGSISRSCERQDDPRPRQNSTRCRCSSSPGTPFMHSQGSMEDPTRARERYTASRQSVSLIGMGRSEDAIRTDDTAVSINIHLYHTCRFWDELVAWTKAKTP